MFLSSMTLAQRRACAAVFAPAVLLGLAGCWFQDEHVQVLRNAALKAAVADNEPQPGYSNHEAGINGIIRLRHSSHPLRDVFVHHLAGMNYEATWLRGVSTDEDPPDVQFEPRKAAMVLTRPDPQTVELYQAETKVKHVETTLRYTLVEKPAAVDFTYRFTLHQEPTPPEPGWNPAFSAFFANYMYDPEDIHLYFYGHTATDPTPRWLRTAAETHGTYWVEEKDGAGHEDPATVPYDRPYFAGKAGGGLLVTVMVDPPETFSLWYSPNGTLSLPYATPAWDLNLIFEKATAGVPLEAKGRMLVLPGGTLDDVEAAYKAWQATLGE